MAKIALLIGVSEYSEPGLTPLPAAVKDVQALQAILQSPQMGGFDQVEVLPNPNRQQMEESVERLFRGCQKGDVLLFYFSGHGITDSSGRFFFATRDTCKDGNGDVMRSRAVAASFMHDVMNEARSRRQVVILDCCHSGAFAKGMRAKDDRTVDIRAQLGGEGRVLLTSSTALQYSFEQQNQDLSVYTAQLVNGIWTGEADLNRDGWISASELYEYTRNKVQEALPHMKPEIYNDKEGYTIFLSRAPQVNPEFQYRREVEDSFRRGEVTFIAPNWSDQVRSWLTLPARPEITISSIGLAILATVRDQLGLTTAEAKAIQDQVLQPYYELHKRKQQYQTEFRKEFQSGKPLTVTQRQRLRRLQQLWSLSDTDILPLEEQVIKKIEWRSNLSIASLFAHRTTQLLILVSGSAGVLILTFLMVSDLLRILSPSQPNPLPTNSPPNQTVPPEDSASPQASPDSFPSPTPSLESSPVSEEPEDISISEAKKYEEEGDNYHKSGKYQQALSSYKAAITLLMSGNKTLESREAISSLFWKTANTRVGLGNKAGNNLKESYFTTAIDDYSKAISYKVDNAEAYEGRGLLKESLKKREGAIKDFYTARLFYELRQDKKGVERMNEELQKLGVFPQ